MEDSSTFWRLFSRKGVEEEEEVTKEEEEEEEDDNADNALLARNFDNLIPKCFSMSFTDRKRWFSGDMK